MAIEVKFFASLKEALQEKSKVVDAQFEPSTVQGLIDHLKATWPGFDTVLTDVGYIRAAVNQNMAELDAPLADGDEVALFPPVTGG